MSEEILEELGRILCQYYTASHVHLYPLNKLHVKMTTVHKKLRKKDISEQDKLSIKQLLLELDRFTYSNFDIYYIHLLNRKMYNKVLI
jgi:hypothetical protein